ncbi:MAG: host-nuclease inhibitor Gam family protein [Candidatus Subteraquimicrobiales bacterium]|nr:host-nuclease inhibitor Gam family protein [Candidatus Subteraquimicrobiales bacterium]
MGNNGRKKAAGLSLRAWEDVDISLRRMGEIDIAVSKIEGEMTLKINQIKAEADAKSEDIRKEYDELEQAITEFCEEHKQDFTKTRNKELTFGLVAFRVVTRMVIRSKEACLAAMHALKLGSYIRVIEEPDKLAMEDLDDAVLAKVGVKRKTEDKLRIEPNLERLKEAA